MTRSYRSDSASDSHVRDTCSGSAAESSAGGDVARAFLEERWLTAQDVGTPRAVANKLGLRFGEPNFGPIDLRQVAADNPTGVSRATDGSCGRITAMPPFRHACDIKSRRYRPLSLDHTACRVLFLLTPDTPCHASRNEGLSLRRLRYASRGDGDRSGRPWRENSPASRRSARVPEAVLHSHRNRTGRRPSTSRARE